MRTAPVGLLVAATITDTLITAVGSDIYLRVTSSPGDLEVWWYRDGDLRVSGSHVLFPAGDRTRRRIGSNFRAGTTFRIGVAGDVPAWTGIVDWNVYP